MKRIDSARNTTKAIALTALVLVIALILIAESANVQTTLPPSHVELGLWGTRALAS